jgi:hypothetical protein
MDGLTLFGAIAVTLMLFFYALEERAAAFVLAFAAACLASSVYGFLQGTWPFGVVELVWTRVALRRWTLRKNMRCSPWFGMPPSRNRSPGDRSIGPRESAAQRERDEIVEALLSILSLSLAPH